MSQPPFGRQTFRRQLEGPFVLHPPSCNSHGAFKLFHRRPDRQQQKHLLQRLIAAAESDHRTSTKIGRWRARAQRPGSDEDRSLRHVLETFRRDGTLHRRLRSAEDKNRNRMHRNPPSRLYRKPHLFAADPGTDNPPPPDGSLWATARPGNSTRMARREGQERNPRYTATVSGRSRHPALPSRATSRLWRCGPSHRLLVPLLGLAVTLAGTSSWAAFPRAVRGVGGAVASAEADATAAGIEMLARGGNAVDAAVATALVLAVVHPQAGNLGGGGFAVVRISGTVQTLDFRETAPAAARKNMYLDSKGRPIPERSLVGPLAAGVPGSPAGLWSLHHRFGKLPWPTVVRPAIFLARDGFAVSHRLAAALRDKRDLLSRFPETAAVWLPHGKPLREGTIVRLPELAVLLRAYAEEGPDAIVRGPAAAAIELASRRHGGILRAADLLAYQPVWRRPVLFDAWGWKVASMGLPSSGGIILGESAGMLERLHWERTPRFGAEARHLLVEAWRRAYADRYLLGDPASCPVGVGQLLAGQWLSRRALEVDRHRATPSSTVEPWPGAPQAESLETTHLSTADAEGNVVSLTTTLNGSFGCGLYVPGVGIFLNNEMDDFATAPGRPNQFGLIQ
ncbi:MAG TPA: gamma-glutamyltransferase family protein, partial [Acidobacteria bacterium]|nr:gamma-glutamyltransferase family protein [Acidobacteriota bacterium]